MPILLKEDQVPVLTAAQVDGNWKSLYGTPASLTINSGIITVNGAGIYKISPQSGTTDDITGIAGATRVGDECTMLNANSGDVLTYKHQGALHLNGQDFESSTIYSIITFVCISMSPQTWVMKHSSANT